jgi:hypothetical protein
MPARRSRFRARGALFAVIACGLIAIAAAAASASVWVVAVAAAVIGLWMGDLARRDLGLRRGR